MTTEENKTQAIIAGFIESLDIFLAAYKGNVGKDPFGLILGPREYTLLCMYESLQPKVETMPGLGSGGVSESLTLASDEKKLPLVTEYKGLSVQVKFTEGCEVLIDPKKAASIMYERIKKHGGEDERQTKIEGV